MFFSVMYCKPGQNFPQTSFWLHTFHNIFSPATTHFQRWMSQDVSAVLGQLSLYFYVTMTMVWRSERSEESGELFLSWEDWQKLNLKRSAYEIASLCLSLSMSHETQLDVSPTPHFNFYLIGSTKFPLSIQHYPRRGEDQRKGSWNGKTQQSLSLMFSNVIKTSNHMNTSLGSLPRPSASERHEA